MDWMKNESVANWPTSLQDKRKKALRSLGEKWIMHPKNEVKKKKITMGYK